MGLLDFRRGRSDGERERRNGSVSIVHEALLDAFRQIVRKEIREALLDSKTSESAAAPDDFHDGAEQETKKPEGSK